MDFRARKLQGSDFCSGKWDFPPRRIASPCTPQFSMVVPLRSQAHLRNSLLHWAYYGLFRALRAAFVRPRRTRRRGRLKCERALPLSLVFRQSAAGEKFPPASACQKSLFDKLVAGGASYPQFAMVALLRLAACSVPLLIGLTSRCFAHWARASCAPRHCHPYQFPLKSCGFSGAETARKRFSLWKMGFSDAKIAPSPPYTPPGTIEVR